MKANLKKLLIRTKKAVFSQQLGNNTSKIKGEGYDFIELREYEDGEDIRKIDWVISAKMQKPYVKVFNTQRELDINIIPILTGSTFFGTHILKKDVITEICATLGYIASAQGDSYTSFIANETATLNTQKTKKLIAVQKMIEKIDNYDPLYKKANYVNIVKNLHQQIPKKSLLFLIGDFFNCRDLNFKLLSKKHELIVIIVRDKFEESPEALGNINLTDPSTSQYFEGNVNKSLIKNYTKKIKENDHQLYEQLKQSGVEFIKIYTDDNLTKKLAKLFNSN